MKLPRFAKLQRAVASLDKAFITKRIDKMEERLTKSGQKLEPGCTAVTEEGIFYVSAEVGLATKVVLYLVDQPDLDTRYGVDRDELTGYTDTALIDKLHPYHIVRCNTLTHAERNGWPGSYRIAQRIDGSFYCRFATGERAAAGQGDESFEEIDNQRLFICPNCLLKVNSLFEGVHQFEKESFNLKYFFNVKYTRSWCRYDERSDDRGTMTDMYPRDWLELCRIRKEQVSYQCEACDIDLSEPRLRKYLHVHHSDHEKGRVGYVKLECLCIACLAEHPARAYLKDQPEYLQYIRL